MDRIWCFSVFVVIFASTVINPSMARRVGVLMKVDRELCALIRPIHADLYLNSALIVQLVSAICDDRSTIALAWLTQAILKNVRIDTGSSTTGKIKPLHLFLKNVSYFCYCFYLCHEGAVISYDMRDTSRDSLQIYRTTCIKSLVRSSLRRI